MDDATLAAAGDANLAGAWRLFSAAADMPLEDRPEVSIVSSGLPIAFFNSAFLKSRSPDVGETLDAIRLFFEPRRLPYLIWIREGLDDELLAAGRQVGLRDAGGPPSLAMEPIPAIPPPPAGVTVQVADDADGIATHGQLVAEGFEMPADVIGRLITSGMLDVDDLVVVSVSVDGEPASCAALAKTGDTAGIYNVATPARFRRRGLGEAATWAAVAEGARRGCTHAILQASEMGQPIYERMGFRVVGRYQQLEGPPAGTG